MRNLASKLQALSHESIKIAWNGKWFLQVLVLATAYVGASKLGFTLAYVAEQVTVVWPPTGISLAAILLLGFRVWPGIMLGAFLTNVTTNEPTITALCIAAGNTLEAVAGAWLLRRYVSPEMHLNRVKSVFGLLFFSAALSTMISATIGTTSLCLSKLQPWTAYSSIWFTWWLGDAAGALIIAPLLLTWLRGPYTLPTLWSALEILALITVSTVITIIIFVHPPAIGSMKTYPYMIFPVIIWAAIHFGRRGVTLITLAVSGVAVWATSRQHGPFTGMPVDQALIVLQTFTMIMAITGLIISAVINERKEAERKLLLHANDLIRSNQALDDFAYIASHDLKEPLRGLLNQTSFILEDYQNKLDVEGIRRLRRLLYLSQRMDKLITDLLYFSRLGRAKLAIQKVDPNETISEIRQLMGAFLKERNVRIIVPQPLPYIVCDKLGIAEIFRNLITNAAKYNDKPERVVEIGYLDNAQSQRGEEKRVFFVKDNGIGIEPEFYDAIFRIFKRLENPVVAHEEGTGSGLTFVKTIVERHKGHVWVESTPGQGSIFYFTLGG